MPTITCTAIALAEDPAERAEAMAVAGFLAGYAGAPGLARSPRHLHRGDFLGWRLPLSPPSAWASTGWRYRPSPPVTGHRPWAPGAREDRSCVR